MDAKDNNTRVSKCIIAIMVIFTSISLGCLSSVFAQWPPYSYNLNYDYLSRGTFNGYFGYTLPNQKGFPSLGTYLPPSGTSYYLSDIRSGWSPWEGAAYYNKYIVPQEYSFSTSIPYYSFPSGSFTSTYPNFIPTSSWSSWPGYYPTTSYSNSKTNNSETNTNVTITGRVVGDHSINYNGRVIDCYVHQMQQAVYYPLDLSPHMGKVVEVSGDLRSEKLYSAKLERVVY